MQKIQKRSSWIKDGTVSDSETATESDEEYDENSDAFTDSDDTEDPEACFQEFCLLYSEAPAEIP